MVDFNTPTETYSAKRMYAPMEDFNEFTGIEEAFTDDSSMGLTNKKVSGQSYKGVKNILNPRGEVVGTITVESKYAGHYPNLMNRVNTSFAENAIEEGSTAVEDTDKRNWKMTLSGETAAGDPFKLTVDESYAVLSGYHLPATLEIFETWADAHTELSRAPTA